LMQQQPKHGLKKMPNMNNIKRPRTCLEALMVLRGALCIIVQKRSFVIHMII
jgi:hypothetical protein